MNKKTKAKIREAVDSLNACYGRGDVTQVALSMDGHGGVFEQQRQYGCGWQAFSLTVLLGSRIRVQALGHQRTIQTR